MTAVFQIEIGGFSAESAWVILGIDSGSSIGLHAGIRQDEQHTCAA